MSYVYFIAAETVDMVKIGFAADPWKRFSKVQSDCPHTLSLIGIQAGSKSDEAALHRRFASSWLRGEWFRLSGPVADHASGLAKCIKSGRAALGGALGAWMHKHGHTVESFGKLTGLSGASISRFCSRKNSPSFSAMDVICRVTAGGVQPNDFFDLPTRDTGGLIAANDFFGIAA